MILMRLNRITTGGQISLPAAVRHRWGTRAVSVEDLGDHLVVRPVPDDPIAAARGALKGRIDPSEKLRAQARADELAAEERSR
jgi:bifunctional DNA-binding transcriptional regulator/antitoxin component of YhaV-PrlF toxin-antitoxin module